MDEPKQKVPDDYWTRDMVPHPALHGSFSRIHDGMLTKRIMDFGDVGDTGDVKKRMKKKRRKRRKKKKRKSKRMRKGTAEKNSLTHHHLARVDPHAGVATAPFALKEAVTSPFALILCRDSSNIRKPQRARQDVRAGSIEEVDALERLPVVLVCDVVRFPARRRGVPSRILGVDQERTHSRLDVLAQVFLVAVIQTAGREPGATPEAEAGLGLRKFTRQQAAEVGAQEFRVHVAREKVRGWEAIPFLPKAYVVFLGAVGVSSFITP